MLTRDIHSHGETAETALYELDQSIQLAKSRKERVLCLIVGYGSSGKTHRIQTEVLKALEDYRISRRIRGYIRGSDLDIFSLEYQKLVGKELIPEEEKKKRNPGAVYILV